MVGGLAVAGHVLFATSMAGTTIDAFHFAAVPRVPHVAFAHAHRIAHAFGNATAVVHATSSRAHFAVAEVQRKKERMGERIGGGEHGQGRLEFGPPLVPPLDQTRYTFHLPFLSVGSTVGVATGPHGIGFAQALHVAIDRFTRTTRAVARGGTTRPRFLRGGGTRDGIRRGHLNRREQHKRQRRRQKKRHGRQRRPGQATTTNNATPTTQHRIHHFIHLPRHWLFPKRFGIACCNPNRTIHWHTNIPLSPRRSRRARSNPRGN